MKKSQMPSGMADSVTPGFPEWVANGETRGIVETIEKSHRDKSERGVGTSSDGCYRSPNNANIRSKVAKHKLETDDGRPRACGPLTGDSISRSPVLRPRVLTAQTNFRQDGIQKKIVSKQEFLILKVIM